MCYSKFAREREDEDTLDLIAAPWEAIPDEEEVQEMLADSSGDWQDEERTLRVLCYWPSYLKHYGYAVEGCTDYNTVFTLDEVELWKVDKYCYVGMPFMSFALNFNSGYSCTPFTNFRVHGSVWTNDETICCTDCLYYDDSDDFYTQEFHAWYNDDQAFRRVVMNNHEKYFCNRCNSFMYTLSDDIDCVICDHIVVINEPYAFTNM